MQRNPLGLEEFKLRTALACPRCGEPIDSMHCTGCQATYNHALGVPFFGAFEPEDALGLIEIAANASNRATLLLDPQTVANFDDLCADYHAATDKETFRATHPEAQTSWFDNRYTEWVAVEKLVAEIDLTSRDVLDIGAGQGFDSWRLALRGGRVTALEFSPILAEAGMRSFPSIRWVGGFSHALPFANASFDFVFINAALHHMRDIPASIAEALRVLRPGGSLITTGDPFRNDAFDHSHEFDVFDRHEAVLLGINEQIPCATEFLATLERRRPVLMPEIFTQMLYGGHSGQGPDLTDWARWEFDNDAALLKGRSGSLAMRIRLTAPWPEPRRLQTAGILEPAVFAAWLEEPEHAVAELARIMPHKFVDTPFPGQPTKFDLLNGWRVARSTPTTRTGFRRARLFRTRGAEATLHFEIRSAEQAIFTFHINARPAGQAAVAENWTVISIDVSTVAEGEAFVLEFRREGKSSSFEGCCFDIQVPNGKGRLGSGLRKWVQSMLPEWWKQKPIEN